MKKTTLLTLVFVGVLCAPGLCGAEEAAPQTLPQEQLPFLMESQGCAQASLFTHAVAPGLEGTPQAVPAQSVPLVPCCVREYVRCARNCRCGVFEFNCTLDFPGCSANCICNICPV